jgi:tetratricopeptide (TPR) repeat protein
MKHRIFLFVAILTMGISCPLWGQTQALKQANEHFDRYEYTKAIDLYEQVLRKEKNNAESLEKVAECYRLTSNTRKAEIAYKKAIKNNPTNHFLHFRLGQALMSNQKYHEAQESFSKYTELVPYDNRGWDFAESCKNIKRLLQDSGQYQITKLPFNSKASDFSPAFFKDGLVFTSNRSASLFDAKDGWTGEAYQDLYYVAKQGDVWTSPILLEGKPSIPAHEGPAVFNVHNTIMYFTRSELKSELKKTGTSYLKLFQAKWAGGRWQDIEALPFNREGYSIGQPALSPDGKTLYFTANFPGGFGGKDIYMSQYIHNKWTEPQNLGPEINSKGEEMFPTLQEDGILFFSSDGWGGLGGLDIFIAKNENNLWTIENLGYPLNSSKDDFGLILTSDKRTGFLASNRDGSQSDDLYRISIKARMAEKLSKPTPIMTIDNQGNDTAVIKQVNNLDSTQVQKEDKYLEESPQQPKTPVPNTPINKNVVLKGTLFSKFDNEPLQGKSIKLTDKLTSQIFRTNTVNQGRFHFILQRDKLYKLDILNIDGQISTSADISTVNYPSNSALLEVIVWSEEKDTITEESNLPNENTDNTNVIYLYEEINQEESTPATPPSTEFPDELIEESPEIVDDVIVTFRVQVGAFNKPKPKSSSFLTGLPRITFTEKSPDGLTKYVSGEFTHPIDAINYRNLLIEKNYKDPFIVVYINGVRSKESFDDYTNNPENR